MKYHDKRFPKLSAFAHTDEQEQKLQTEAKKLGVTKSEVIRRLIDALCK